VPIRGVAGSLRSLGTRYGTAEALAGVGVVGAANSQVDVFDTEGCWRFPSLDVVVAAGFSFADRAGRRTLGEEGWERGTASIRSCYRRERRSGQCAGLIDALAWPREALSSRRPRAPTICWRRFGDDGLPRAAKIPDSFASHTRLIMASRRPSAPSDDSRR